MVALLGVGTGLLVFLWTRALFGNAGGLIALTLFAFSPSMLALAGTATTDLSITLTLFASTWAVWRLLQRVALRRIAVSLFAFVLLVLAKPSALVILPIAAVLVAVRLYRLEPWDLSLAGRHRRLVTRRAQAAVVAVLVLLHAAAGIAALWAHYGFRYAASPRPEDPTLASPALDYRDGMASPLRSTLRWIRDHRLLPEGFHRGIHTLAGNDDETVSFLRGEWTVGGQPWFFPYAIAVKTAPPIGLLVAAGTGIWVWQRRRPSAGADIPSACTLAPVFALVGCYLGVALVEDLNIGHRHILPVYPALFVLAGGVGLLWRVRVPPIWRRLAVAVAGWTAVESFAARPDYLAYFGPQAGGSENGYKHLVDSSVDWGMDLPALKTLLDRIDPTGAEPVFLSYFGTDSPRYHGIRSRRLPGFFDRRRIEAYAFTPGIYAISATLLQSTYNVAIGPWSRAYEARYRAALARMQVLESIVETPGAWARIQAGPTVGTWLQEIHLYDALRTARLCAWLRHARPPDHRAGHSILIWRLTFDDLAAALLGPPAELHERPLPRRQYGRYVPIDD